jgi:hypothetical protein
LIEISFCGRNKPKYLIPLNLKVIFVQTEENELVFVLKFINRAIYNNDNEENENLKSQYCVLTDNNFIIQTFIIQIMILHHLLNNSMIINKQLLLNQIKSFPHLMPVR